MSQVLKNLQFVTQSFTGTPNIGTGVMFASASKLYFENAAGTLYPLGGPGYLIVREYTGSNPGGGTLTYTWNKPDNIKYIQVICVGAGGGGGSGVRLTNASFRGQGGSGGGGGAIAWGFFDKNQLTQNSYTVSVGGGGAGGAAATVSTGITGTNGQYTTFGGTLVSASGGTGGVGGPSNSARAGGAGGLAISCLPGPGFAIPGGTGGNTLGDGTPITPLNFFATPLTPISTAGGGAGGGWDSIAPTVLASGSSGSSGFQWNTLQVNGGSPGKPATVGSDNLVTAAVLLQFTSSIFTTYGLGGGGHGGDGTRTSTTGFAGSNAGNYGAGGGGGGAVVITGAVSSGAGGSGSSGLCIITEYY